jgi:hypothetical protein
MRRYDLTWKNDSPVRTREEESEMGYTFYAYQMR